MPITSFHSEKEDVMETYALSHMSNFTRRVSESLTYSEYAMNQISVNYLLEFDRGKTHKWKLGAFFKKVKNSLKSYWLKDLVQNQDDYLINTPLESCNVTLPRHFFLLHVHRQVYSFLRSSLKWTNGQGSSQATK